VLWRALPEHCSGRARRARRAPEHHNITTSQHSQIHNITTSWGPGALRSCRTAECWGALRALRALRALPEHCEHCSGCSGGCGAVVLWCCGTVVLGVLHVLHSYIPTFLDSAGPQHSSTPALQHCWGCWGHT